MTNVIDQFIKDMKIRNLAEGTQRNYLYAMQRLSDFYQGEPPEKLTDTQVQDYIHHLSCERHYSWSHIKTQTAAFRFFYGRTLRLHLKQFVIPVAKSAKKLPEILSRTEVRKLLQCIGHDLRKSAYFSLLYGCGLRGSEACQLRIKDINSDTNRIWVRNGKGAKDRGVYLPNATYRALALYWQRCRFEDYLFTRAQNANQPMRIKTPQLWLKSMKRETGIVKGSSLHLFRHSYATHALEDGENLINIQRNLGHVSISTTLIYTKLAQIPCQQMAPIDRLYAAEPSTPVFDQRN